MEPFDFTILAPKNRNLSLFVFSDFSEVSSVFKKSCGWLFLSANGMIDNQTWQMHHTLKHYWHPVRGQKNWSVNVPSAAQGEMLIVLKLNLRSHIEFQKLLHRFFLPYIHFNDYI